MILTTSASSLSRFQSCELAHYYGKVKRLTPIERPTYFDRGTLFHEMLKEHYLAIKLGVESLNHIIERVAAEAGLLAVNKTQLAVADPTIISECASIYRKYALNYAAETWEILAAEQPFSFLALEAGEDKVILEGRIDLVAKTRDGEILIVDHKTVSKQGFYAPLTNQFLIYALVSGARTITANEIGFQKTPVFRRASVSYMPGQIEEFSEKILKPWLARLLSRTKSEKFLANTSSCKYCDFRSICETTESAREWKETQLFKVSENFDVYAE